MSMSIGELVGFIDLDTGPAEKALGKMDGLLGGAESKWGGILAGVAAGLGGAFAASLVGAINLEPGRDRVAAALLLTEAQAERAGSVAGSLYADAWGESAEDMNVAVEAVMSSIKGMRKASESELRATTEAALTFSTAMGVDVSRAAQVAGQMVSTGLAKNAGEAFDLLTAASSKVPVALREDVLDATDEYGQFFAQLGIDGPQAMGMLVKGAQKGMYGIDKMGDAVKEFTIRATDGSEATSTAFEQLGLDFVDMPKKLLKGGPTAKRATNQIIDAILAIEDPADRAQTALTLFGTPLEDLSTKDVPKFLRSLRTGGDSLGKFKGSTAKAGKALNDNAKTNLTAFTRGLQKGFIDMLGGKVLPKVTELTGQLNQSLGPALSGIGTTLTTVTGFLTEHATAVGIVAGLLTALLVPGWILAGIAATKSAYQQVAAWVMQQAAAIKTVAVFVASKVAVVAGWALMGAKALLGAAKVAAAWLIAMGPIGLVIAAVVGITVLVVKNWDKIKAWTIKAWNAVSKAVSKAWAWIKSTVTKVGSAIASAVSRAWSSVTKAVSSGVQRVLAFIVKLATIPTKVGGYFLQAAKAVLEKIGTLVGHVKAIPGKITSAIGNLGKLLWNAGSSVIQGLIDGVMSKVETLKSKLKWITDLIPKNKGPIDKDRKLLKPAGEAIMDGLIKGLEAREGKLRDKLSSITDRIASLRSSSAELAGQIAGNFRSDVFGGSLAEFDSGVQTDTRNARSFKDALAKAVSKGLSGGLLRDLATSGNLALAQEFAGLSRTNLAARQASYGARTSAANAAGSYVGKNIYGPKLDKATAELRGIRADLAKVLRQRKAAEAKQKRRKTEDKAAEGRKLRSRG